MEQYTNYCTEEQTHIAYELGAPIKYSCDKFELDVHHCMYFNGYLEIPTTQQMFGWLREKRLNFSIFGYPNVGYIPEFTYGMRETLHFREFKTAKEAELDLIDAALNYLEKGK